MEISFPDRIDMRKSHKAHLAGYFAKKRRPDSCGETPGGAKGTLFDFWLIYG